MDGIGRGGTGAGLVPYGQNNAVNNTDTESTTAEEIRDLIGIYYDDALSPADNVLTAIRAGVFPTTDTVPPLRGLHFVLTDDSDIVLPSNIRLQDCIITDSSGDEIDPNTLSYADVDLRGADLSNVDLISANLSDTDISNVLYGAPFGSASRNPGIAYPSSSGAIAYASSNSAVAYASSGGAFATLGDAVASSHSDAISAYAQFLGQLQVGGQLSFAQVAALLATPAQVGALQNRHPLHDQVKTQLTSLSANWEYNANFDAFKNYFLTKMWGTKEAQNNPEGFAKKQLDLLEQMDKDPTLREACFVLAVAGNADCHDNAFAMFLKMQEKALEIEMGKPNVPKSTLISYGLALENKDNLEKLIERTPELKHGVDSRERSEALEAQLALELLCHQRNIPLPVPVTSMIHEGTGWAQFKGPEDGPLRVKDMKIRISQILDKGMPSLTVPSAKFLSSQPFWQLYVDTQNSSIIESVEFKAIKAHESEQLGLEDDKLFGGNGDYKQIEASMNEIRQKANDAIANLYVDETKRLLHE